jgi:hypothetical protein
LLYEGGVLDSKIETSKDPGDGGILARCAAIMRTVNTAFPQLIDRVRRVIAAAVYLHRARACDLSVLEHVYLIHILEGGVGVRAHNGSLYSYRDGAWHPYSGCISEEILYRCRMNSIAIEGLFTMLGDTGVTAKGDAEFLGYVKESITSLCQELPADRTLFDELQEKALVKAEGNDQPSHQRFYNCASTVRKFANTLQKELMSKAIITCYIEWCETDCPRKPGTAFKDCCVLFKKGGGLTFVDKAPEHDVYIYLPHNLKDPVLEEAAKGPLHPEPFQTLLSCIWYLVPSGIVLFKA